MEASHSLPAGPGRAPATRSRGPWVARALPLSLNPSFSSERCSGWGVFGQGAPQARVGSEQGPGLGQKGGGVPATPTHRGDQRGSLTTASMLRAPQHWAGLPGSRRWQYSPGRDQEDGEGSCGSGGPRSQASRPDSGDEARQHPLCCCPSHAFTEGWSRAKAWSRARLEQSKARGRSWSDCLLTHCGLFSGWGLVCTPPPGISLAGELRPLLPPSSSVLLGMAPRLGRGRGQPASPPRANAGAQAGQ